nr:MAG TPA: hypothetical protein [Caudoviricetes sp.]DAN35498.1 MAG TPA: hypothetical protein [Caudoviricetes sp.]DAU43311.1 MAG TPA: hypothetical protein [Bacteriophage sp.]
MIIPPALLQFTAKQKTAEHCLKDCDILYTVKNKNDSMLYSY